MSEVKEMMGREEAEKLMRNWADIVELDTDRELFADLVEELSMSVRKEKLSFDEETEIFKYILLKPVGDKTIIEIRETTFEEKKAIQKFKDSENMDAAGMMMSKHTNLTTAEVLKLKTRDQNRINAVIMGFLSK